MSIKNLPVRGTVPPLRSKTTADDFNAVMEGWLTWFDALTAQMNADTIPGVNTLITDINTNLYPYMDDIRQVKPNADAAKASAGAAAKSAAAAEASKTVAADIEAHVESMYGGLTEGATYLPTPSSPMARNANGCSQVENPVQPKDAANKRWVESLTRQRMTGNTTIYVRTDGNNANTGFANTAAGALRDWAGVLSKLPALDLQGKYALTVQFGPGDFSPTNIVIAAGSMPGTGLGSISQFTIQGESKDTTALGAIEVRYGGVQVLLGNLSAVGISALYGVNYLGVYNIKFVGSPTPRIALNASSPGTYVHITQSLEFEGTFTRGLSSGYDATIRLQSTATSPTTITFTDAVFSEFLRSSYGDIELFLGNVTFEGSFVGKKWYVDGSDGGIVDFRTNKTIADLDDAIPGTENGGAAWSSRYNYIIGSGLMAPNPPQLPQHVANRAFVQSSAAIGGGMCGTYLTSVMAATSGTWIAPDLNSGESYTIQAVIKGAGGSGGSANALGGGAGGGGEGETVIIRMTVKPGEPYPYAVGEGGARVTAANASGNNGGVSTMFGQTAAGGTRGLAGLTGGAGGGVTSAAANVTRIKGQAGASGLYPIDTGYCHGGYGGGLHGGRGWTGSAATGVPAAVGLYGCGGGGTGNSGQYLDRANGAGGDGFIMIWRIA